jgi:hypothetical protein
LVYKKSEMSVPIFPKATFFINFFHNLTTESNHDKQNINVLPYNKYNHHYVIETCNTERGISVRGLKATERSDTALDIENIIFETVILNLIRALWKELAKGTHGFQEMNEEFVTDVISKLVKSFETDKLFQAIKTELLSRYEGERCHSSRYLMFISNNTTDFNKWFAWDSTRYTVTKHLQSVYDKYLKYLLLFLFEVGIDCEKCEKELDASFEGLDDSFFEKFSQASVEGSDYSFI